MVQKRRIAPKRRIVHPSANLEGMSLLLVEEIIPHEIDETIHQEEVETIRQEDATTLHVDVAVLQNVIVHLVVIEETHVVDHQRRNQHQKE
jgi:hypothetical protein